jgi:hypothetical protein
MSTQATLVGGDDNGATAMEVVERHPTLYSEEVGDGYKVIRVNFPKYYFEHMLTFSMQVENTLFRFHFAILISFSQLFVPPKSLDGTTEGGNDETPIVMCGDSAMHWEGLIGWASFET